MDSPKDKGQPADRSTAPHLIHIGFPKCASTFLQYWFGAHPEIAYIHGGFAGHASIFDLAHASTTPEWAKLRVTSAEIISVPFDPAARATLERKAIGSLDANRVALCDQLATQFPDATILITTRGFEDVIRSSFSQLVRVGSAINNDEYERMLRTDSSTLGVSFAYDRVVNLYRKRFGGRVLVIPFELLRDDRRAFLNLIEARFGLSQFDIPNKSVNASLRPEELYWYPRLARYVPYPLHVKMVESGAWRPLVALLRLRGRRSGEIGVLTDVVEAVAEQARELVMDPAYAPYRAAYGFPED